jgi:carbon-monoxide dehydrogenase medium subunit
VTDYCYPASIEEAVAHLAAHDGAARIIAGGTDVLPDMRKGRIAPRCLVDVTRIPALGQIEVSDAFVTVGAAVTFAALAEHAFLRQHVHALVDAARSVGAAAIQNAATWVGNIVQAMPAADGAIIACALDAEARIVDRDGARWHPVGSLFEGPGVSAVDPTRQLVTHVRFPRPDANTGTAWRRIGRRSALVLPILNCAVRLQLDGHSDDARMKQAAIALGPVAPRPTRARKAEDYLIGRPPTEDTFAEAGRIARSEANPRTSVMRASRKYRLDIIPVLVSEALSEARERGSDRANGR